MRNVQSLDSPSLVVLNYGNRPADRLGKHLLAFEELATKDHSTPAHKHKAIHFSEFWSESIENVLTNHLDNFSTRSEFTVDIHSSAQSDTYTSLPSQETRFQGSS